MATTPRVHPTGLVDPAALAAKTKLLAAEALRGAGGSLIDARGARFVDEGGPARCNDGGDAGGGGVGGCEDCNFYVSKGLIKRQILY
ncbi:hypothetical protein DFH09DRAFT_1300351 [Mycena vulgaris]|nr:hypothetical protein DFH09DRAFT_1300351 [Mycena vulgaris]